MHGVISGKITPHALPAPRFAGPWPGRSRKGRDELPILVKKAGLKQLLR
jgi:hypothetical protein